MVDATTGHTTILAWNQGSIGPTADVERPPDLHLHLVHVGSGALTVEVLDGFVDSANGSLFLAARGWFDVTATVRRVVDGRERNYLRLRPAIPRDSGAA